MKNWLAQFVRVCAVFSAAAALIQGAQSPKAPLLVLLDGDTQTSRAAASAAGWQFLGPWTEIPEKNIDLRLKALETRVADTIKRQPVDENRIYLAGQGEGAAAVLYVVSRLPDLWAGAVAVGGAARPAIDTGRIYAVNTTNLPVLWVGGSKDDEGAAEKLKAAGFNLEFRLEPSPTVRQVMEWLAAHQRESFPATADCEIDSKAFARCYWIEVTGFDPAERNDALPSSRVPPVGSGAYLDLGGFGYDRTAPGPGVLVSWLPPDYKGPLKLNDRIVALGGKNIPDGASYAATMEQTTEERALAVSVQRGKDRLRLETRIVVPRREVPPTARVQGRFAADTNEIVVMSRAVGQMRVTVPPAWVPAAMNWNGTDLGKADTPGCWLFEEKKTLLSARKCEDAPGR